MAGFGDTVAEPVDFAEADEEVHLDGFGDAEAAEAEVTDHGNGNGEAGGHEYVNTMPLARFSDDAGGGANDDNTSGDGVGADLGGTLDQISTTRLLQLGACRTLRSALHYAWCMWLRTLATRSPAY